MASKTPAPRTRPATPKRPAHLAEGRWLGDFGALSAVEQLLIDHCARGVALTLGTTRPKEQSPAVSIRAGLIRFLLLGGDDNHPVHEEGVMIRGAWITGTLDLHQGFCPFRLDVRRCHFDQVIEAASATIPELALLDCVVSGLEADQIKVNGSVFFRTSVCTDRPVRLLGAEIGGNLELSGGQFLCRNGDALLVARSKIKGDVFMDEDFTALGTVRMLGTEIGGNLHCDGKFTNNGGIALHLDGAKISDGLFLRGGTFVGEVNLTAAYAGTLVDDRDYYKSATLILDGFRYDRIVGPTDADVRISWLQRQQQADLSDEFKPQPWEQLIRVLRDMGHPAEAARIAMAKQLALRDARQIGLRRPNTAFVGWRLWLDKGWNAFSNILARWLHWFYGWIAGYGHRPTRIVWRMALVCTLCSLAYYGGRQNGLIGPSSPLIHLSPTLAQCGTGGDPDAIYWTSPDCPVPPEYSTFQPFFYSLDVILPLVDLHQEADWGPVVTNEAGQILWGGRALRWILWFEIIFGWIASVMFVAIVGRLVDKD